MQFLMSFQRIMSLSCMHGLNSEKKTQIIKFQGKPFKKETNKQSKSCRIQISRWEKCINRN